MKPPLPSARIGRLAGLGAVLAGLALCSCAYLQLEKEGARKTGHEHPSEHPRAQAPSVPPKAAAAVTAIVEAARRLDEQNLASLIAGDYNDAMGRDRYQLLRSFRDDHNDFLSADITLEDMTGQSEGQNVLVRFVFTWRGTPRAGPEKRFRGQAEWVLKEEGEALRLSRARGDTFIGIKESGR